MIPVLETNAIFVLGEDKTVIKAWAWTEGVPANLPKFQVKIFCISIFMIVRSAWIKSKPMEILPQTKQNKNNPGCHLNNESEFFYKPRTSGTQILVILNQTATFILLVLIKIIYFKIYSVSHKVNGSN